MTSLLGALSSEQHAEIKNQIRDQLQKKDIFASLKAIVSGVVGGATAAASSEEGDGGAAAAALIAAQHKSVLARLVAEEAGSRHLPPDPTAGAEKPQLLHVLLLGGRAFAHPEEEAAAAAAAAADDAIGSSSSSGSSDTICACLHFGSQRFRSKPAAYCAEPELRDGVLLELPPPDELTLSECKRAAVPSGVALERLRGAFRQAPPMHLLIIRKRVNGSDGSVSEQLLSSCMVEWRQVLHKAKMTLSVELPGVGAEASLPTGCIEIKLELVPSPHEESRLSEPEVMIGLKKEREAQVDAERKFFAYARSWWSQYLDLSPTHQTRPVKLFALSELGTQRPVTAFVQPLQATRLIETPAQAAHFVSLLAHSRDRAIAAGPSVADVWRTTHSTLATRSGETEEHALLLCSLLLGFGLDAYVCIGTDGRGPHVWVMTRSGSGSGSSGAACAFWESLSGQTYELGGSSHGGGLSGGGGGHPYLSLACVFSHETYYANTQPSCALDHAFSFDLTDTAAWKAMECGILRTVTAMPQSPLAPSPLADHAALAVASEAALRTLVDQHRASLRLDTPGVQWDPTLGHTLSPALYSYESERIIGTPSGQRLFSDAIRRLVPKGHTFKGLPMHFTTYDAKAIFTAWLASDVAAGILQMRTYKAAMAVRVRVFPLPDGVVSVWTMLAMAYRPEP